MERRSNRLLSTGYYEDNVPQVSYKEKPHRVFKRRRSLSSSGASTISDTVNASIPDKPSASSSGHTLSLRLSSQTKAKGLLPLPPFLLLLLLLLILMFSGGWVYTVGQGGDAKILRQQLKELQEELLHLKNKLLPVADTMQNFALESQGACILHHLTSESLTSPSHTVTFLGIPLWYQPTSPRIVIQAHFSPLTPGHCWAFKGTQGQLFIGLSHTIRITHVTLGHILAMQNPNGFPTSAPRIFSVYGLEIADGEAVHLKTFLYNPNGDSIQTFKLSANTTGRFFSFVKLQIEDNWGNPDYTCLYNFRVHGRRL